MDISKEAVQREIQALLCAVPHPEHAGDSVSNIVLADVTAAIAMLRTLSDRVAELEAERIECKSETINAAIAEGRLQGLDEAAELSAEFTHANHVAQDMKDGIFPEQSPVREAISRAIEALKGDSQ